jgi:excisionase family DNA binding protein
MEEESHFRVVLTPGEVAKRFRVDPKTVSRWGAQGLIKSFFTPGGHRRFYLDDVEDFIAHGGPQQEAEEMTREVDDARA